MSVAVPPRVHLERFAVGSDAIDANRHVNNKEYLHWMEAIAIAHSAACGWPLERYVASGTSWFASFWKNIGWESWLPWTTMKAKSFFWSKGFRISRTQGFF